jgi:hypothetical protein
MGRRRVLIIMIEIIIPPPCARALRSPCCRCTRGRRPHCRSLKRPPPETVSAGRHRVVYSPPPPAQQDRLVNAHPPRHREAGVNDAAQHRSGLSGSMDLRALILPRHFAARHVRATPRTVKAAHVPVRRGDAPARLAPRFFSRSGLVATVVRCGVARGPPCAARCQAARRRRRCRGLSCWPWHS